MRRYHLGLDVGGTNLAASVIDEEYNILSRASLPAGAGRGIEAITADMALVSRQAVEAAGIALNDVAAWGIGMPSYVNPANGLLVHANCFGWRNVPIYQYLTGLLPLPIYIENDANCAVLGETLAGSAKGHDNVLMLTLGTGVGGGILIDGRIYSGADTMGAEFGHTKLVYGGRRCTCGQQGCVDEYCSARGLRTLCMEEMEKAGERNSVLWELCGGDIEKVESRMIPEAAMANDALANVIWEKYIDLLSCAIGSFIAVFRPEIVLLGGGVANAGDFLLEPLRERVLENTFAGTEIGVPEIRAASRGNDAGLIGAAFLPEYGIQRWAQG